MELPEIVNLTWLTKDQFMEQYAPSDSTYKRRIDELREHKEFKAAYIQPTNKEVWIVEEIYKSFLLWKSENKYRVVN